MDRGNLHQLAEEFLQAVIAGDDSAFEKLYQLVHRRVYFFLFRMLGCRETSEDVLIDTFTIVWKNARQFEGKSSVYSWILGIARNLALNEIRYRKPHEDLDDYPHIAGGAIPDMTGDDQGRIIKKAMTMLSSKHREIIEMVFYHELNYPEVSALLEIPVGTVKTRIFHAKAALKNALSIMKVDSDVIL